MCHRKLAFSSLTIIKGKGEAKGITYWKSKAKSNSTLRMIELKISAKDVKHGHDLSMMKI